MFTYRQKGLYAIASNTDTLANVKAVLQAGAAVLQYREKRYPDQEHALQLKNLCKLYATIFIINDHPELARAVHADGVHLGERDDIYTDARALLGDDAIIGVSCYDSLTLALDAERQGASYVAFGSFFPSQTKLNTRRPNRDLLKQARAQLSIPIVAIGGITPENGQAIVAAGADYLAAIHGIFGQEDPGAAAKKYIDLFLDKY